MLHAKEILVNLSCLVTLSNSIWSWLNNEDVRCLRVIDSALLVNGATLLKLGLKYSFS